MVDITSKTEEEILAFDVSDEVLEIAAVGASKEKGKLHARGLQWPICLPKVTA